MGDAWKIIRNFYSSDFSKNAGNNFGLAKARLVQNEGFRGWFEFRIHYHIWNDIAKQIQCQNGEIHTNVPFPTKICLTRDFALTLKTDSGVFCHKFLLRTHTFFLPVLPNAMATNFTDFNLEFHEQSIIETKHLKGVFFGQICIFCTNRDCLICQNIEGINNGSQWEILLSYWLIPKLHVLRS